MKLYHRTNFWGWDIKARWHNKEREVRHPVIWVQAVDQTCYNHGLGCCRRLGDRVVEIKETHFLESYRGEWYLYQVSARRGNHPNNFFHKFVLVPRFFETYSFEHCTSDLGWTYVGSVRSCMARMDLGPLLHPYLKYNGISEMNYSHVHIGIFMNSIKAL